MAHNVIVRTKLHRTTPVDYIHPTMDFTFISASDIDTSVVIGNVKDFFTAAHTVSGYTRLYPLDKYFAHSITRGSPVHEILVYAIPTSLDPADHMGSPIATDTMTFPDSPPSGTQPLPDECAITLSWEGDNTGVPEFGPLKTRLKARRRGRTYLGPFNSATLNNVSGDPVVDGTFTGDLIAAAAHDLYHGVDLSVPTLGVWSRASHQVHPVYIFHVDSLWDTRRKRGDARPSFRVQWPT